MATYAIVENNVVTNIVVWDGFDTWTPPSGSSVVRLDSQIAGIGYLYSADNSFTAPSTDSETTA